jgi:hypothetical protein
LDTLRAVHCDLDLESGAGQTPLQHVEVVFVVLNAENLGHRDFSFPAGAPRMTEAPNKRAPSRGNS